MSLINPALLFGLVFAVIPVILHLMMRAKPKKLLFPALRLIQKRRMQNVRRIRLRHLWLLLLRMLVLAVLALAITRPSLPAANYSLRTSEWLTIAVIVVVLVGVYFGAMYWWKRQAIPQHTLLTRRTYLRGGLGTGCFLLFLLLVAWPWQRRIAAELSGPVPEAIPDMPVAAVLMFDTSLSMDYRHESQSRLEIAQEIATEHITHLPGQSRVAVADTTGQTEVLFQADLAGAQSRIETLETGAASAPLNERLRTALALQEDDRRRTLANQDGVPESLRADRFIREIYIFTDLSASAWKSSAGASLREQLKQHEWVGVYLIDVGLEDHRNMAVTGLNLSRDTIPLGDDLLVDADVSSTGYDGDSVTVEFYVDGENGQPVKTDQREITLRDSSAARVQFGLQNLERSRQGELRLVTSDPLASDNSLHFSVGVAPPVNVLVVSPAEDESPEAAAQSDAAALLFALQLQNCETTFWPASRLDSAPLAESEVVCLVNVPVIEKSQWERLSTYVEDGGGLLTILGSSNWFNDPNGIRGESYEADEAQAVLPGKPAAALTFAKGVGLDVRETQHPVLRKFNMQGMAAEVSSIPVRRYWKMDLHPDAKVVLRYTDPQASPAMIERVHGRGRSVVMTTGFNPREQPRREWSGLARHWAFVVLVDQTMQYLSRRSQTRLNFTAGDDVFLDLDRKNPLRKYLVRKPSLVQLPGEVEDDATVLRIPKATDVGHYSIISTDDAVDYSAGFSVNVPASESDFKRLSTTELDDLLGEQRYSVARNTESLTRSVTTGRLGMEVFPIVLALMIVVFCLELTVSNRFYEADNEPSEESNPAAAT